MAKRRPVAVLAGKSRVHRERALTNTSRARLGALLIVLAGVVVYWNSLSVPFHYDDDVAIVRNSQIRRLWPLAEALSPPGRGEPVAGRPIANLSFAINYALGGLTVEGYHIGNVGLHVLCALLLFGIVRRTLRLPRLGAGFGEAGNGFALACALVWLLHPMQTAAVTYLSARTELLMGTFYLLTLYASIRANTSGRGGARAWSVTATCACALGMASKESMVTAPLMVLLYDRTFLFDSWKDAFRLRRNLYVGLAATWLELAALVWSGPRTESAGFTTGISAWTYLLNQSVMILQYLRRAIWPVSLVFDYGEPRALTLGAVAPHAAGVLALLLIAVLAWIVRPRLGFLGLWFFVTLAPTSSILPIATEVGADRRMYLPLAGLVVLAVLLGRVLWEWARLTMLPAWALSARATRVAPAVAVALACTALGAATVHRNREYSSGLTLWRTVLERWPSARAHRNLATELRAVGYRDEVLFHLRQTLSEHPEARYALGFELFDQGKFDEAVEELQKFIQHDPTDPNVNASRELIGRALSAQGKHAAAAEQFRLLVKSQHPLAHFYLADALRAQKDLEGAVLHYRTFLAQQPESAAGWNGLGVAQLLADQTGEAVRSFERAVELDPRNAAARRNLANALLQQDDFAGAIRHAEEALRLSPRDAVTHYLLGLAFALQGKLDEAIVHFQESVAIDPANPDARTHLARALELKSRS